MVHPQSSSEPQETANTIATDGNVGTAPTPTGEGISPSLKLLAYFQVTSLLEESTVATHLTTENIHFFKKIKVILSSGGWDRK
jgi:hypothetical protein